MKTYTLPIQFQFNGTVEVQASSEDEAKTIIEKNLHATSSIKNNQDNQSSITDYNIDMKWDLIFRPLTMDALNIPH